jgi:hypothetical protein
MSGFLTAAVTQRRTLWGALVVRTGDLTGWSQWRVGANALPLCTKCHCVYRCHSDAYNQYLRLLGDWKTGNMSWSTWSLRVIFSLYEVQTPVETAGAVFVKKLLEQRLKLQFSWRNGWSNGSYSSFREETAGAEAQTPVFVKKLLEESLILQFSWRDGWSRGSNSSFREETAGAAAPTPVSVKKRLE